MKIGITYNLKDDPFFAGLSNKENSEEFDSIETIHAISNVFKKNGFEVVELGGNLDIVEKLKKEKVFFVFNIAEGYYGRNRESTIPSILEMLNTPYSGSDPLTLGLALDKVASKKILQYAKVQTPSYWVIKKEEDLLDVECRLRFPMITKPAWEGSSKGIYDSSKVFDKEGLVKSIKTLLKKYPKQPILVEEYIKGREITAAVIGNEKPEILGLMEMVNKDKAKDDFFYSLETKRNWEDLVEYKSPPELPQALELRIKRQAIVAFKEFGCRDIARIDFKVSEYNEPFVLEINPLPGLSPKYGDLVIMAKMNNIGHEELVLKILNAAFSRYNIKNIAPKPSEACGI
ncbi:MAG: ATP-grasp domain-containing protein [Candidatus Omnitrophota bacterium]